jgi:hypothetical protein
VPEFGSYPADVSLHERDRIIKHIERYLPHLEGLAERFKRHFDEAHAAYLRSVGGTTYRADDAGWRRDGDELTMPEVPSPPAGALREEAEAAADGDFGAGMMGDFNDYLRQHPGADYGPARDYARRVFREREKARYQARR